MENKIIIEYAKISDTQFQVHTTFDKNMKVNDMLNILETLHDSTKKILEQKFKKKISRVSATILDLA
jgi:uncharacterized protein with HEPN domain